MSLKVKRKKENQIPLVPGGSYPSTCVGMIDLGQQYEKYQGRKQGSYTSKQLMIFELIGETVEIDGEQQPRWLYLETAQSLKETSKLYKTLTSWLGRPLTESELDADGDGFDMLQMLGESCILSVTVKDKVNGDGQRNEITGVIGLPKGLKIEKPKSELLAFDIDDRDEAVFEKLPEWIQKKIEKSTQYQIDPPEETPPEDAAQVESPAPEVQPEPPENSEEDGKDACPI